MGLLEDEKIFVEDDDDGDVKMEKRHCFMLCRIVQ